MSTSPLSLSRAEYAVANPALAQSPIFVGNGSEAPMQAFTGTVAGAKDFIASGQAQATQQGPIMAQKLNEAANIGAALYKISTGLDALWFTTLYGGFNTIVRAIQQVINQ